MNPSFKQSVSTRLGRKITVAVLLLLITFWSWQKITNPNTLPIRDVKIIDTQANINHEQLRQAILPFINNGMLDIDKSNLKNVLSQIPWVGQVNITRHWPDKLIITIMEQTPVAFWNNQQLLNTQLTPFNPGNLLPHDQNLPLLFGPPNEQTEVWNAYQTMNAALAPINLKVHVLSLTPRGAWEAKLNNGLVLVLGREDVVTRLERLVQVYPKIFVNNISNVEYVDLRYSNGLAVKWKNNSTNTPATP